MNSSKTILIFSDWYHPGFRAGGPVQSVFNLANLLSRYFVVKVVTRITDLNSSEHYPGIQANVWTTIGENHFVQYLDQEGLKNNYIKQLIKQNSGNIIFINGLYSFKFSVLPSFYSLVFKAAHVFIAVRGMLHQSALSVKPVKKQVFLAFARGFGLYKNASMLASSDKEKIEISRILGKVRMEFAPNIPLLPRDSFVQDRGFKDEGKIRFLFLGRIAPEKNPLALVEALNLIKAPCCVIFCGTGLDRQYLSSFMEKLNSLPENIEHRYIPEMPHALIGDLLDHTDVMVLPSLGENFGHAIFESFVHSVPVIIGNNTPWSGIEEKHAGIEVDPQDINQLKQAMEKFIAMDQEGFQTWRKGAYESSKAYFRDNNFEEIYLRLFS